MAEITNICTIVKNFREQIVEGTRKGEEWKMSTCPDGESFGWPAAQHHAMEILARDLNRDYGDNVLVYSKVNHEITDWSVVILGDQHEM